MSDNQEYYKLSDIKLQPNEIVNITNDYNTIMTNWNNPNISIEVKKYELAQYYTDQGFSRSYALQASYVVLNQDDINGNVANSNIEDYYKSIGVNFTEQVRLNVSFNLIKKDFQLLKEQDFIIPNENEITDEHVQVFKMLGIPITYWGGSIFANNNINFVSGIKNFAETINSQYMSNYMPSKVSDLSSFGNLLYAAFPINFSYRNYLNTNSPYEFYQDSKNLIEAIITSGVISGVQSVTSAEDIKNGDIDITDSYGNNLLSISSLNNVITYNVGNVKDVDINNAISNIIINQNNSVLSLKYTNGQLNELNINNSQWVVDYLKNNIYHNGQLYNNKEIADIFNQNILQDKIKSNLNIISQVKDPIIFDITGKGFNITPFTIMDKYENINNISPISQKMQWIGNGSYFLVSIGNNDQPIYYTADTLKTLDTNGDGIINSNDKNFSSLYLWNGKDFTLSNVLTLSQAGINSISLTNPTIVNQNIDSSAIGTLYKVSSSSGLVQAGEINLQVDSTYTTTNIDQDISDTHSLDNTKFWVKINGLNKKKHNDICLYIKRHGILYDGKHIDNGPYVPYLFDTTKYHIILQNSFSIS